MPRVAMPGMLSGNQTQGIANQANLSMACVDADTSIQCIDNF